MSKNNSSSVRSSTSKHANTHLRLYIVLLIVAAIAVLAILLYRHNHVSDKLQSSKNGDSSIDNNNAKTPSKTSTSPGTTGLTGSDTTNSGSSTTGTNNTSSFTVQIVSDNVSDNNVHIGTMVSGTSSGSCTLTATQVGQNTLTLGTSSVKQDVNNYDCGIFNVRTSTFPSTGTWKLLLTVTNNGLSSSDSANVTI
jgi:cytoskeletal protein RodZ